MRTESHGRLVAVLHLAHVFVAAASAVGLFLSVAVLFGFKAALEWWLFPAGDSTGSDPEFWFYVFAVAVVAAYVLIALLFTVPAIAGGFGLLTRRRWAREARASLCRGGGARLPVRDGGSGLHPGGSM